MCLCTVAVVALPVEWGSAGLSQGWVEKPVHVLDVGAGFLAGSPYIHIAQKTKINFNATYLKLAIHDHEYFMEQ